MPSIVERNGTNSERLAKRLFYGYCNPNYEDCNNYSTGARIGTGIGVAVFVVLVILLIVGCGKRRRRLAAAHTRPTFQTSTPAGYFTGQQPHQSYQQGYYPQTGHQQQQGGAGTYEYPPQSNYGTQPNYAPPEGPPPTDDPHYSPPSVPPPVYRESEKKERGVVDQ